MEAPTKLLVYTIWMLVFPELFTVLSIWSKSGFKFEWDGSNYPNTRAEFTPRALSSVFHEGEAVHAVKRFTGLYTGPYFDPTTTTNITTQLGTHAYIPCKIKQLGNKSVSWIRKRDAHILTVDRYTFIADDRFQAFFVEATDTWTLQVKYVQARDAGQYECQVSTEPKMSHFITLNVVVPKIEIEGESDIYVKRGSTVQLKCVITQSLEEPAYIFWYHDGERVVKYDQGPIDIRMMRKGTDTTISTITIFRTRSEDSGNYTCSPSNLDSASAYLHVLNGSLSLAKLGNQTKNSQSSPASSPTMVFSEEYKKEESDVAENDFIKSLCDKIQGEKPSECFKNGQPGKEQFHRYIVLLPLITMFTSYLC